MSTDDDLIRAAGRGDAAAVRGLIDKRGDINVQEASNGITALMAAEQEGHAELAASLVRAGSQVERLQKEI